VTVIGGGQPPAGKVLARRVLPQSAPTPAPNQVYRLYYYAGARRVAVRVWTGATGANDLYFLHSDHLGSTTVTTDLSQNIVGQQRYFAYGEPRNTSGTLHTDRRFTGQREETGLGSLYDYNARYYSPLIGRFVSADTLVPGAGEPQAFNRYSYANNSPMVYVDPSGHDACTGVAGTYEPDCGVDGWHGVEDYEARQKLRAMWEQSRKEAWDFFGGIVTLIGSVLFEPIDWAVTASDCLSGNCSPLALVGLLPVIPASVANRVDDVADATTRIVRKVDEAPTDLYAFGNASGPRAPRAGKDVFPDGAGLIGPEAPPFPHGASTFGDVAQAPLTGHYHRLPGGTQLPDGLGVVADGLDVNPLSSMPPTHHTIYPNRQMPYDEFVVLYEQLPWQYVGKK
jgi:RHS repeat-associated protein